MFQFRARKNDIGKDCSNILINERKVTRIKRTPEHFPRVSA